MCATENSSIATMRLYQRWTLTPTAYAASEGKLNDNVLTHHKYYPVPTAGPCMIVAAKVASNLEIVDLLDLKLLFCCDSCSFKSPLLCFLMYRSGASSRSGLETFFAQHLITSGRDFIGNVNYYFYLSNKAWPLQRDQPRYSIIKRIKHSQRK